MKKIVNLFVLFMVCVSVSNAGGISVIPIPSAYKILDGNFILDKDCSFSFDQSNAELKQISGFFNDYLAEFYGFKIGGEDGEKTIRLIIDQGIDTGDEGYHMLVNEDGITITAQKGAGIFYGIQTLKQLLPVTPEKQELKFSAVEINDQPRFVWRGNMLDAGRHFFPVSFIKKYLDILAMYKLNVFHWHLTEDQGWRIEIKKYPNLVDKGSWRDETIVGHAGNSKEYDGIGYSGFYTQDQIREIVKYAADRYITIVPEIEMPGHSSAALTAYPWLGCTGGPYEVQKTWGVFKDVYCAGKEETFTFLQDVLDEVMDLFPSEFIHVGGDECPKDSWEECPLCQKRIKEEGLANEHELQSYFIKRMDTYLSSKGRRLIGWDEILEGGLAPQATVMSWRGIEGGIAAAKQRHDVVMSPTSNMYFDYYQSEDRDNEPLAIGGYLPVEKVYGYEPVPEELTSDEAKHILGAQANLWTEYITNTQKAEYMLLPRLEALSEVVWSPKEKKNLTDFENRLVNEYKRLEILGVNFRDHRK